MSQVPNYIVEDSDGLTFISQLNALFAAVKDDNTGSTAPADPAPFMRWRDTSVTPSVLRIRNAANTAWVSLVSDLGLDPLPAGSVIYFAANAAPGGFLKANGAAVSRSTYATLFAAIGTTFGAGNGSTTFNLPDLRGEFIRGWDDGRGIDAARAFGSAQSQDIQSHTHGVNWLGNLAGGGPGANVAGTGTGTATTTATGGSETRPRNIALLPCIKF